MPTLHRSQLGGGILPACTRSQDLAAPLNGTQDYHIFPFFPDPYFYVSRDFTISLLWLRYSRSPNPRRVTEGSSTVLNVRSRLALIPGGGSTTKIRPARSRLTGSLGFISIVRNSRKLACGCKLCNFFSNWTNQ